LPSSCSSSRTRARARALLSAGPLLVAAVLVIGLATARPASALPYAAPDGKVLVGVTGGRTVGGYVRAAGKSPAMFQFFVNWGDRFRYAYRRAEDAGTGLMVHLSTYNGPGTRERITPRDIALGRGDRYLASLRRDFAAHGRPVYLRPFGEMNNAANPYCAYGADGRARGSAHTASWFRQAWRRVYLVVKGGRVATIDARLRALGMPRLRRAATRSVSWLPRAKVAVQWTPMTAGSPNVAANSPGRYWPGSAYVDWVGTDFYSRFPNFSGLDRFYATRQYAGKPFLFGEWAMWGRDDATFVRRFFAWVAAHRRVRMLAYNQGNRTTSRFRLYRYPQAARVMRRALRNGRYEGRPVGPRHRRARSRRAAEPARRAAGATAPRHDAVRNLVIRPTVDRTVRETVTDLTGSLLDRVLDDLARIIDAILALLGNAS
jgi:hypothetical protein